jgi:hypothetical protein
MRVLRRTARWRCNWFRGDSLPYSVVWCCAGLDAWRSSRIESAQVPGRGGQRRTVLRFANRSPDGLIPYLVGHILTLPPIENGNGAAMSSSPPDKAREGNEDVAAPFELGGVSKRESRNKRKEPKKGEETWRWLGSLPRIPRRARRLSWVGFWDVTTRSTGRGRTGCQDDRMDVVWGGHNRVAVGLPWGVDPG